MPETTCARLVEANVFGLGYVRLTDDCRDGQAGSLGHEGTRHLADCLYSAAIAVYQEQIGPHTWFWEQLEHFLAEWRSAGPQALALDVLHAADDELHGLARLGSPLQISVAAVYALARQEDQFERLAAPVRSYLVAAVLLDHMSDWREDLRDGRPNLFVRALLGEQPPENQINETRLRMSDAMLQPEGAQAYLELAAGHLRQAISASRSESLDGLTEYLVLVDERTRQATDQLVGGIRSLLRQAADMLFSP